MKDNKAKNTESSLRYNNKLKGLLKKIKVIQEDEKILTIDEFISFMKEFSFAVKNPKNLSQNNKRPITLSYNLSLSIDILNALEGIELEFISVINRPIEIYELLTGKSFFKKNLTFGERIAAAICIIGKSAEYWKIVSKELITLNSSSVDSKEISKVSLIALEALVKAPIFRKPAILFHLDKTDRGKNNLDDWIADILEI